MSTRPRTNTPPVARNADSGIGSVLVAAFAAVGAAAIVLQLGGCAGTPTASEPSSETLAAETAWNSPSYRSGWYDAEAPTATRTETPTEGRFETGTEPVETTSTVVAYDASPSSSTSTGSHVVRTSLFPEFDGDFGDAQATFEASGDTNVSQVSFAAEGADFDPDIAPDGSWMIFASTQHDEQPDLYRKSIDGRVVTQLTSDPSQDLMPEVSPDGRHVAFASDRFGNWDVFVMSVDGGPVTQVTFDASQELHPTWSPDGKSLCYCRYNDHNGRWELWTLAVDRPGARSFLCEGMFPRWSPDQSRDRILFQRSRKRGDRLYGVWTIDLVDGEGMNPTEIVAAGDEAVMHPTWSPTGARIAYSVVSEPSVADDGMPVECDIWVIDADGTDRVALTSGGHRHLRPTWGGDDRVSFMSDRGGIEVIWAVSATTPDGMNGTYAATPKATEGDPTASQPVIAGVDTAAGE